MERQRDRLTPEGHRLGQFGLAADPLRERSAWSAAVPSHRRRRGSGLLVRLGVRSGVRLARDPRRRQPAGVDATTYLLRTYLRPAASTYLAGLSEADRTTYLTENPWITWSGDRAGFSFEDFLGHLGSRKKTEPAFAAFDLSAGENNEFGTSTVDNRHFTEYSARHAGATVEADIPELVTLMNPIRST